MTDGICIDIRSNKKFKECNVSFHGVKWPNLHEPDFSKIKDWDDETDTISED